MKNILIITYYFPPYTGIEGIRLKSFADNFYRHGLYPIVLTRHWEEGKQQTWKDYIQEDLNPLQKEENEKFTIYRVPHIHRGGFKRAQKYRGLKTAYYWLQKFLGRLQPETETEFSFYGTARELIKANNIKLILVSSPPLNIIRLAKKLSSETGVPFAADFRDLYDNNLLNPNFKFHPAKRLDNIVMGWHIKRWLHKSSLVISVSTPFINFVTRGLNIPKIRITNGFEKEYFSQFANQPVGNEKFKITLLGSLYEVQEISFMIKGFNLFLQQCPGALIRFIGLSRAPSIVEKIKKELPAANLFFTPRLPRSQALALAADSHVLYMLGWRGYKGLPSGKLFEYLGLKRNILLSPTDHDEAHNLVLQTRAGKIGETPEEMATILLDWYKEFERSGSLFYNGNANEINKYSREEQAQNLAIEINKLL